MLPILAFIQRRAMAKQGNKTLTDCGQRDSAPKIKPSSDPLKPVLDTTERKMKQQADQHNIIASTVVESVRAIDRRQICLL